MSELGHEHHGWRRKQNGESRMIDFEKKRHYRRDEVDEAHELIRVRGETLAHAVKRFNETVEQAEWVESHRSEIRRLEMSDGSVLRGERAEYAWRAFNNNDWDSWSGLIHAAKELEEELDEAGLL